MKYLFLIILCYFHLVSSAQTNTYKVVAYISSDAKTLERYNLSKVTHLIYGFAHLNKEGNIAIFSRKDTAMLQKFKELKIKYPHLKTMIALGGWTGCYTCSEVFSKANNRIKFAESVKDFLHYFKLDGIDLDWEYPAIQGPEGHLFQAEDKVNFTDLVIQLRKKIGNYKILTFAAGGFMKFLEKSIEWEKIEPVIDFVNLMSYDLIHGNSTTTGHQSALFSNVSNEESIDKAVHYLEIRDFPKQKIVVGVPFYIRFFKVENTLNNGLYQKAKFLTMIGHHRNDQMLKNEKYEMYWDEKTQVPYWFQPQKLIFATGDNKKSIQIKCTYIQKNKLGGIMFWELANDFPTNGLLDAISFQ